MINRKIQSLVMGNLFITEIGLSTEVSITKVPDATIRPSFSPVSIINPHFVVIDLETTGLSKISTNKKLTRYTCIFISKIYVFIME